MYRLYQQIDYSQRISRRIFVYFIPFCSTNRQLVVGEVALEVHSVQSDHDSTALSDVILPHPHVLLSQTAIKRELEVIICVFTGYLIMIVQRGKIKKNPVRQKDQDITTSRIKHFKTVNIWITSQHLDYQVIKPIIQYNIYVL